MFSNVSLDIQADNKQINICNKKKKILNGI